MKERIQIPGGQFPPRIDLSDNELNTAADKLTSEYRDFNEHQAEISSLLRDHSIAWQEKASNVEGVPFVPLTEPPLHPFDKFTGSLSRLLRQFQEFVNQNRLLQANWSLEQSSGRRDYSLTFWRNSNWEAVPNQFILTLDDADIVTEYEKYLNSPRLVFQFQDGLISKVSFAFDRGYNFLRLTRVLGNIERPENNTILSYVKGFYDPHISYSTGAFEINPTEEVPINLVHLGNPVNILELGRKSEAVLERYILDKTRRGYVLNGKSEYAFNKIAFISYKDLEKLLSAFLSLPLQTDVNNPQVKKESFMKKALNRLTGKLKS